MTADDRDPASHEDALRRAAHRSGLLFYKHGSAAPEYSLVDPAENRVIVRSTSLAAVERTLDGETSGRGSSGHDQRPAQDVIET